MQSQSKLVAEIVLVDTMHHLVQTYEQVYVSKIRQIRDEVLEMRYFIDGLSDVYNDLRYASQLRGENKKGTSSTFKKSKQVSASQKEVAVLLSTSTPLAGEINHKVFNFFWEYVQKKRCGVVIIGKTGENYFLERDKNYPYKFFNLPESQLHQSELTQLLEYLLAFDEIQIFYGKYKSLLTQQEVRANLRGQVAALESNISPEKQAKMPFYIFEPNINELMHFFEEHIFNSLVAQSINESYLAQVGSRIVALENAVGSIADRKKKLLLAQRSQKKRQKNRKQLQAFAGISFWKL